MRHSASKALFEHWSGLCRGTQIPDRNDLDPVAIGAYLQDVFILGTDTQGQWQYRVAGTRLSSFAQRELRGETFQRWWRAADRLDSRRLIEGAVQDNSPVVGGVCGIASDQTHHDFELLLLPLRHGGKTNQRMLGGLFPSVRTTSRFGVRIDEIGLISVRTFPKVLPNGQKFGQEPPDFPAQLDRRRTFRLIQGGAAEAQQ